MYRRRFRLAFLPLALGVLALGACEGVEAPGSPSVPEFSVQGVSALRKLPAKARGADVAPRGRVIGPAGGTVDIGGHRLIVPRGAVSQPTRFALTLVENGYIEIDLRATRSSSRGADTDVGKQGFSKPVTLHLSYDLAADARNPEELYIAWVRPDGTLVPLPSTHEAGAGTVSAPLDHFSRFVLATP